MTLVPALLGLLWLMTAALPAAAGPFTEPGHPILSIVAWVSEVDELVRGPQDIASPELGVASSGAPENVLGAATADPLDTVTLGDGGSITVYLESGISNGPLDDFAVFENGFFDVNGLFAEFAFVEVSSNGVDFVRFDSDALNTFPVAPFATLDPTDYYGLAGRHETGFGTGFDLADLASDPLVLAGTVNILDIQYVRVVDVIGDGSTTDGLGNPIYDPYPTAFAAGGFDLEAVGVIHVAEPVFLIGLVFGIFALTLLTPVDRSLVRIRPTSKHLVVSLVLIATASPAAALTATFDDLGLGAESTLNGSTLPGGFESGGVFFENDYVAIYDSFSGFAASTTTDNTTPGYGNQFSNITGSGAGGSAGFGIAYSNARLVLPTLQIVLGAEFTNTTYSALSMLNGDMFSKQFGGASGTDPDFFRLLIEGIDELGGSTGVIEFMLADYRDSDDGLDYVLEEWVFQDLTALGLVKELQFSFESSDVGVFGINTPVYFAIDNLTTIPEPGIALLVGFGLLGLAARGRDER
jgi:hypothetical protein